MKRRTYQSVTSLILLMLLIWFVEPGQLLQKLANTPFERIIPWCILYEILVVLIWSAGIFAMLRRVGGVEYRAITATGFKMQGLSMVVPGRLGDIGFIYFMRGCLKADTSAAILLVDKLLTVLVAAVLATAGVGYFYSWWFSVSCLLLLVVLCLTVIFLISQDSVQVDGFTGWIHQNRFGCYLLSLHQQLLATCRDRYGMIRNLFYTLLRIILAGVSFTLILSWFGINIPLWYVIIVQAMIQIAVIIPITYMGIGIVEAVSIYLLGQAGVDASIILAASLAARAVQVIFYIVIVTFWLRPLIAGLDRQTPV